MSSVNKVILLGNVASDVEIRSMQNGDRVANLSLATNERWTDKNTGEKKEKAQFHRIVVFNQNIVNVVEKYVKKGSKIYIEGTLETRSWEKDGQKQYTTEVILKPFGSTLALMDSKGEVQAKESVKPSTPEEFSDNIPFRFHDGF